MVISVSGPTKSNKPNHDGTFIWGCYSSAYSWTRLSFQASCFEIYKYEILTLHFFIHTHSDILWLSNYVFTFVLSDLVSFWIHGCSLWRENRIYQTQLSSHYCLLLQRHFMWQQIFMLSRSTQTLHQRGVARGLFSPWGMIVLLSHVGTVMLCEDLVILGCDIVSLCDKFPVF
jgi:hypothetical protein